MSLPFTKAEKWLDAHTGDVDLDKISNPIRVTGEEKVDIPGRGRSKAAQYDFAFKFRGTNGKDLGGNGRLFLPTRRPRERMPVLISMHYEIDINGSARFLRKGIAVITPHGPRSYTASNLMGHGVNHSVAMAQLPRRMPFFDQNRVVLFGGSAGGYHALMASSFVFPLTAVYAAVPPLNLKYNMDYVRINDRYNKSQENPDHPAAPVVRAVLAIAEETAKGGNPEEGNWNQLSPVFRTEFMTFPTVMTYVTADALVPVCQLSRDLVREPPPGVWPKGFSFDMEDILQNPDERTGLLDVLSRRDYQIKVVKTPETSPTVEKMGDQLSPEEKSRITEDPLLWSKNRRFSIYVLDEGPPEPFCGHAKYHHSVDDRSFFDYHFSRGILEPQTLTLKKLEQLMQRFVGIRPDLGREYSDDDNWQISRLDRPHIERWYVSQGLEVFARGNGNTKRLVNLYRRLPVDLKVLDLPGSDGSFVKNPLGILLYHQLLCSIECGDFDLSNHLMRRLISMGEIPRNRREPEL